MRTYLLWALSLTTHVIQVIGRLRIWGQSLKVCGKWIFRTAKSAENKNSAENGSFPHTLQCGKVFPEWQSVEQTKQKCGKMFCDTIIGGKFRFMYLGRISIYNPWFFVHCWGLLLQILWIDKVKNASIRWCHSLKRIQPAGFSVVYIP